VQKRKKKILFWGDTPVCNTGFGNVSKNILKVLYETGKYEIEVAGINHRHTMWYDQKIFPYKIYPCIPGDSMAYQTFRNMLQSGVYDIIFTLNDVQQVAHVGQWILQEKIRKYFRWVNYSPIDSEYLESDYFDIFNLIDYPVIYSDFAEKVLKSTGNSCINKTRKIYHGTDIKKTDIPTKVTINKVRNEYQIPECNFVLMSVNRNQYRKDFYRLMTGFKNFQLKYPEYAHKVNLVIHSKIDDIGGDLMYQKKMLGYPKGDKSIIFSQIRDANFGISRKELFELMASANLGVTATTGEGWGLSNFEFMALGVPVLLPNNSTAPEFIGNEERGYLVKCGTKQEDIDFFGGNSQLPRPRIEIDDFADKILYIINHYKEAKEKAKKAQEWAINLSWDNVCKEWIKIFEKASQ